MYVCIVRSLHPTTHCRLQEDLHSFSVDSFPVLITGSPKDWVTMDIICILSSEGVKLITQTQPEREAYPFPCSALLAFYLWRELFPTYIHAYGWTLWATYILFIGKTQSIILVCFFMGSLWSQHENITAPLCSSPNVHMVWELCRKCQCLQCTANGRAALDYRRRWAGLLLIGLSLVNSAGKQWHRRV